ncbi:MAG: transposase [Acidimicrobiales bacterium]
MPACGHLSCRGSGSHRSEQPGTGDRARAASPRLQSWSTAVGAKPDIPREWQATTAGWQATCRSGLPIDVGGEVIELEVMPGHVHLVVEVPPAVAPPKLVRSSKGRSSRMLRAELAEAPPLDTSGQGGGAGRALGPNRRPGGWSPPRQVRTAAAVVPKSPLARPDQMATRGQVSRNEWPPAHDWAAL